MSGHQSQLIASPDELVAHYARLDATNFDAPGASAARYRRPFSAVTVARSTLIGACKALFGGRNRLN